MRVQLVVGSWAACLRHTTKGLPESYFSPFWPLAALFSSSFSFFPLVGLIYCGLFGFGVPKCPLAEGLSLLLMLLLLLLLPLLVARSIFMASGSVPDNNNNKCKYNNRGIASLACWLLKTALLLAVRLFLSKLRLKNR